jgi:hypothetical protein
VRAARQLVLFTTVFLLCGAAAASANANGSYGAIGKTFRLSFIIEGNRVNLIAAVGLSGSSQCYVSNPFGVGQRGVRFGASGDLHDDTISLAYSNAGEEPGDTVSVDIHGTLTGNTITGSFTATETFTDPSGSFTCQSSSRFTAIGAETLTANPGGPYNVTRGGTVHLNGSRSTPRDGIVDYTWTFVGSDCPNGVTIRPGAVKHAAHADAVILCTTTVRLTVRDGSDTDSKDTTITVVPRRFGPIPFTQIKADAYLGFAPPGEFDFGTNKSIEVWISSGMNPHAADRWLDPGPDPTNPSDTTDGGNLSVDPQQVHDPDGPYDRDWYVADEHLKMDRIIVLNSRLIPGGPVYKENTGQYRRDLALVVAATREHEQIHSDLALAKLKEIEKTPQLLPSLEEAIATSQGELLTDTNATISAAERELKVAAGHANVLAEMRRIYGYRTVTIRVPDELAYDGPDGPVYTYATRTFDLAAIGTDN